MACYNLDLDEFLPLASETIGYDFSSLQSSPELDLEFLANESVAWNSSSQGSSLRLSPVSTSPAQLEDKRRSRHQSTPSDSSAARAAAQLRRKEQNRAAQQAYRKRKEDLIRSLENKIERLESTTFSLQVDNARLQSALQCLRAENDYLQSASSSASSTPRMSHASPSSRST